MDNYNSRLGMVLFLVYLIFYVGFVGMVVFAQNAMESLPLAGVNLAVWYGFALILLAFVLAIVYGFLAHADDADQGAKK